MANKIHQLYLELLEKYGEPKPWPWKEGAEPSTPFEICIGAILTQNTNWQNVEKAIVNLKRAKTMNAGKLAAMSDGKLENYLKPSGFYRQKTQRVKNFCQHIVKNYHGELEKLWEKEVAGLRQELLSLKGIGPETADTMLLYGGKKLIFVIDEYTRRFVKRHGLSRNLSYEVLQNLFMKNLTESVKIYEDYHALIVKDGKVNGKNFSPRSETQRKIPSGKS